MEENRHGPERLGQITPKREKNRGKNNSSGVGVVLGNRCLEVLRGGCTLPPKPPLPSWSSSRPAKDLGWWHSCGWVTWAFQAFYPIGFGTIPLPAQPCLGCKHLGENLKLRGKKRKTQKKPEPGPIFPSASSASWKLSCRWEAVEKPCQCQDECIHVFPLVWAWVWSQGSEGDRSWDGDAGRDHSRDAGKDRVGSGCCSCDPSQGHTPCTLTAQPLLLELDPAPLSDGGGLEGWTSFAQRWTFPWKGK